MLKYKDRYSPGTPMRNFDDSNVKPGIVTLAKSLDEATAFYYEPKSITLRNLIEMAAVVDREVGLLINTDTDKLCVTKGGEAGVTLPVNANFTFIAHSHPTISANKSQISGDMSRCGDQVEVAVNMDGLIMYYSEGRYYNRCKDGTNLGVKIEAKSSFLPGTIGLDTPVDMNVRDKLGTFPG